MLAEDGKGQLRPTWPQCRSIWQPGRYQLPALQVQWWSTTDKALHTATLPAVHFTASANPAYALSCLRAALDAGSLNGARIGVMRFLLASYSAATRAEFERALHAALMRR